MKFQCFSVLYSLYIPRRRRRRRLQACVRVGKLLAEVDMARGADKSLKPAEFCCCCCSRIQLYVYIGKREEKERITSCRRFHISILLVTTDV